MVRRIDIDPAGRDERLGEAVEAFLALDETGQAPDPSAFAAGYPELGDDLRAALDGLALVRGWSADRPAGLPPGGGPAGRRLPDRPRAGPRRHGRRLRGRPRRPGPPRRPEGARRRRGARLRRPPPVPQRGPDRRRAAPHPHRAGLRRRPGRRPVLLRDATDRGLRPGPRPPRPAARPRDGLRLPGGRARPAPSGGAGAETITWDGRGDAGAIAIAVAVPGDRDDDPPPFAPPKGSDYYRWVARRRGQAAEALAHAHRGRGHSPRRQAVEPPGRRAGDGLGRPTSAWPAAWPIPGQTQADSLVGTPGT
jgi:hypothetical protein